MNKLLKSNKGFTLVEVIVVAVIVLILAAVAIPLYNGYIRDARQASLENVAGSIAACLGAAKQASIAVSTPTGGTGTVTGPAGNAAAVAANFVVVGTVGSGNESRVLVPKNMQADITETEVTVRYTVASGITGSTAVTMAYSLAAPTP